MHHSPFISFVVSFYHAKGTLRQVIIIKFMHVNNNIREHNYLTIGIYISNLLGDTL